MKCQPKANNNRKAVVVCTRHVVKRPSKRMRANLLNIDISISYGMRDMSNYVNFTPWAKKSVLEVF